MAPGRGAGGSDAWRGHRPLTRTPAREDHFLWAVALFDDPSGFATLHLHPPDTLDEAQALPRIAVLRGGPDEAFLRARGFSNLAPMPGRAEAVAALHRREVSAWFCAMPKLRADLGNLALLGRPVVSQPAWLAMNPQSSDVPLSLLREAFAALKADGSLQQILRPFLVASR
jgi:polar amino acid transport system substrate-binding protein